MSRFIVAGSPTTLPTFEQMLFGPFTIILQQDIDRMWFFCLEEEICSTFAQNMFPMSSKYLPRCSNFTREARFPPSIGIFFHFCLLLLFGNRKAASQVWSGF